jgi:hypothetical protein
VIIITFVPRRPGEREGFEAGPVSGLVPGRGGEWWSVSRPDSARSEVNRNSIPSPHVTSRGIASPPHAPGHLTRLPKRHRNTHKAEEHARRAVAGQQPHPRLSAEPFVDAELLSIRGHHDGIRDVMPLGRCDSHRVRAVMLRPGPFPSARRI